MWFTGTVFHFYCVDASSCRTSHILSALSALPSPPPSLSLRLINNTALAILAFLWFLWSWHALAWSRLPSGSLGMAARAAPAPCSPTIVFVHAIYISSVSSEGYTDSGSARQCSPDLCFEHIVFSLSHRPFHFNIIWCRITVWIIYISRSYNVTSVMSLIHNLLICEDPLLYCEVFLLPFFFTISLLHFCSYVILPLQDRPDDFKVVECEQLNTVLWNDSTWSHNADKMTCKHLLNN